MGFHRQSTQTASASAAVPAASNNVVVQQAQPVVVLQQQGGCECNCSIPPEASRAVKATRWSSVAIIIIHAIALIAYGFFSLVQWVASLIGIIMGSVLLCVFNKCCYITAAVLFSITLLLDVIAAIIWLAYGGGPLAIPAILGAVVALIGIITASMATCGWDDSWGVKVVQSGPVQVSYAPAVPSIHVATVQPNYSQSVASKGAPSTYSSGV